MNLNTLLKPKLKVPHFAWGMLLLIVCAGLLYKAHLRDLGEYTHTASTLKTLKELDAVLTSQVLEARLRSHPNYDSIVQAAESIQDTVTEIKKGPANETPELKLFESVFSRKIELIEEFKSNNSVLKNSLNYLPSALSDADFRPGQLSLRNRAETLTHKLFIYNASASQDLKEQILSLINFLSNSRSLSKGTEGFLKHAKLIATQKTLLDELVSELLALPTSHHADSLFAAYSTQHRKDQERSNAFSSALFLLALVFGAATIFALVRLRRSAETLRRLNESLETRVQERTQTIADQQQRMFASSKLASLGEMAAGIAHEINNPLTVISATSEELQDLVAEQQFDHAYAGKLAHRIEATSDRIAKIVRGLRDFSRDGSDAPFASVDLSKVIQNTLALCNERFKKHGIPLRIIVPESASSIQGDEIQIEQVLLNLLNNAFDAVIDSPNSWVEVKLIDAGSVIQLTVSDSGRITDPTVLQKLFIPFFTTKEVGKGTGLGLSVSKGIITAHRGDLAVDLQAPNTRFVITLPTRGVVTE